MAPLALPPSIFNTPPAVTRQVEQLDSEILPSIPLTPTIYYSEVISQTNIVPPTISAAQVQGIQHPLNECHDDVPGWQIGVPETLTTADFETAIGYQLQAYLEYVGSRIEFTPPNNCNPMHSESKEPLKTIMMDRVVTAADQIRNQAEVSELVTGTPLAWDYIEIGDTIGPDGTVVREIHIRMNQSDLSNPGLTNGFILMIHEKNGSIKGISATQSPNTISNVGWDQLIGEKQTVNMLRVEYGEFGTGLPDDPAIAFPVLKIFINKEDANVQFDLLTAFRLKVTSIGSPTIIPDAYLMDPHFKTWQDWFWQFIPSVMSGIIVPGNMAASLRNLRKAGYQFVMDENGVQLINTRKTGKRPKRNA